MTTVKNIDLPSLNRSTIGFDRLVDGLEKQFDFANKGGYPPYNVVQQSENEYQITLAVAGFDMDHLSITQESNTLRIEGHSQTEDDKSKYLHRGIAARSFTREFTLADHVEVVDASLDLGLLTINLRRKVPEEKQPKRIQINSSPSR